jgi:hypothetical protein
MTTVAEALATGAVHRAPLFWVPPTLLPTIDTPSAAKTCNEWGPPTPPGMMVVWICSPLRSPFSVRCLPAKTTSVRHG